jgi:SAM-dependent methyltransferase
MELLDRHVMQQRRQRAEHLRQQEKYQKADFLLDYAIRDIAERLSAVERLFENTAILLPTKEKHQYLKEIKDTGKVGSIVAPSQAISSHSNEAEIFPFEPDSLNLVISTLTLQDVNDLPGMLIQIRRALKPDGLCIGNLIGGTTLDGVRKAFLQAETELSGGAAPRIHPMIDIRDLGGLLQRAGFALNVSDADTLTVRYDSFLHLLWDLRAMGATNILTDRSRKPLRRDVLLRAGEIYSQLHTDADGRVRATFSILSFSGWTPHESQQKPLKPGSAKIRLADALGTKEIKT